MSAETVKLRTTIEPEKEIEVSAAEARDLEVLGLVYTPEEEPAVATTEGDEDTNPEAGPEPTVEGDEFPPVATPGEAPAFTDTELTGDAEAPKKKGRS